MPDRFDRPETDGTANTVEYAISVQGVSARAMAWDGPDVTFEQTVTPEEKTLGDPLARIASRAVDLGDPALSSTFKSRAGKK